ncbi:MAG: DNA repair protein RecO [uncultured bacterium]|nr:MAG: DNA repair protein RecO [uncultured bacterium]
MKRVMLQPAYVLHRRPYRESSFLIELFTLEYGRLTGIAKGARQQKSSILGLLQPFTPLQISWVGKAELMTITQVELNGEVARLQGDCLFAGFYLNELLITLLEKWDPHIKLFSVYADTIAHLAGVRLEEKILRSFEKFLLEDLGYGLLPKTDISLHNKLSPEKYYRLVPEQGWVESELGDDVQTKFNIFSGKTLLAIAKEDWSELETLQDAKRLTRIALAPLLGKRPIYSRQLFLRLNESE